MRFIKSFTTGLVTALLATSAFGELTQLVRSPEPQGLSVRAPRGLGADPGNKKRADYVKFCSKAQKKKGKRDVDVEEREVVIRAKPDGYLDVSPGSAKAQKASETVKGLFSDGFGTCVGIAFVGTPPAKKPDGINRILMHLSLGAVWADIDKQFRNLEAAVEDAKLTSTRAVLFTIDTRNSNPELSDPDLKDEATNLELDYARIFTSLKKIADSVTRSYHPFSNVGEMQIDPNNRITWKNS
ncbi:hypothetical protein B0H67DRAFT_548226 [Lasiosphaeris hirsuta]|uniref:Uncharacterized protein n=1 Tax=Lasiosphaeris hirsuta TaxID=260670 RepID=A0AA40B9M7_9PEZI|nr:hypothetical protein B0H67DRAFT_548226 [Lasiosphaeris hirsuta]